VWAANLLVALEKAHVFAQAGVINRDYEGEISQFGDSVHITSISDPTIGTYTANSTTITAEELTDARRTLTIDQARYFAFKIDDVDKRQARGNVMTEAMRRAGYKLRDVVDAHIAGFYTSVPTANAVGTVAVTAGTPTDAYDKVLVPLKVKLDEANVPSEGRWVVIPPWLEGRLILDGRFIKANESADASALRNGQVGRAAGFTIMTSNNTVNTTGDDYAVLAGTDMAISFAEQISQVEAYRDTTSFSDIVRGLHLWGAKVIRPEGLASAVASQT
jgi:N4-gp56 family major capsid protein